MCDYRAMPHLREQPTRRRVECVVIGAGVVGAAVAQHLARRGVKVAVLERVRGIGGGCSYANAAILAPHHVVPLATPALLHEAPGQMLRRPPAVKVRPDPRLVPWLGALTASAIGPGGRAAAQRLRQLALDSTGMHRDLADKGVNPSLRKTGALDVYLRAPRRGRGGLLTSDELRALEPALAPVAGGMHDGEEWTVESRSFVTAMLEDAADHGAEVHFGTPVHQLLVEGARVVGVRIPGSTLHADHVVLAAGMGSVPIAAQAGVTLPLRGGRGYVVDLSPQEHGPSMPVRIKDHRVVVTPLADRVRVSGVIEFGGEATPIDHRRPDALRAVAAQALPALRTAEVIDRWAGERPCTPDGVPVIGPSGVVDHLSVATGHGMWGLILAPVTARLIAESVIGSPAPGEEWLSPDRFGGVVRAALARATRLSEQAYGVPSVRMPSGPGA